jgi:ribosomal protein S13
MNVIIPDWILWLLAASFFINSILTSIQIAMSRRIEKLKRGEIVLIRKDVSGLEEFLRRAISRTERTAAIRGERIIPRWAHVADLLGLGSTRANDICARLRLDPDAEEQAPCPEPACHE